MTRLEDESLRAISGPDMALLRTEAPLRGENMKTVSEFTLSEGQSMSFVLTYASSYGEIPKPIHPDHELQLTTDFWADWSGKVTSEKSEHRYEGDYTEAVRRSLVTLKALTYDPTGGMVAAPTTFPSRTPGRKAQLGLPFLLVA